MLSEASPHTDEPCLSKSLSKSLSLSLSKSEHGERFDNDPDFDFDFEGSMVLHCKNLTLWQRFRPLKDLLGLGACPGTTIFQRNTHRLRRGD
jgi:hypothetical protein